MIESDDFVKSLEDIGFDFFTGVPDSNLGGIIAELMERRLYTPAVREDEAVAMAAGAYMAGQNSRRLDAELRAWDIIEYPHLPQLYLSAALYPDRILAWSRRQRCPGASGDGRSH